MQKVEKEETKEVETTPELEFQKLLEEHNKLLEEHRKLKHDYERLQFHHTLLETYFVLLAWHNNNFFQFPEIIDDIQHWFPDIYKKILLMDKRLIKTADLKKD